MVLTTTREDQGEVGEAGIMLVIGKDYEGCETWKGIGVVRSANRGAEMLDLPESQTGRTRSVVPLQRRCWT